MSALLQLLLRWWPLCRSIAVIRNHLHNCPSSPVMPHSTFELVMMSLVYSPPLRRRELKISSKVPCLQETAYPFFSLVRSPAALLSSATPLRLGRCNGGWVELALGISTLDCEWRDPIINLLVPLSHFQAKAQIASGTPPTAWRGDS
jgi:hypothetical protein